MVVDQNNVTALSTNRHNEICVFDMFYVDNSLCFFFFYRAQSHLNWLWNKRLSYLNFKNISKIPGISLQKEFLRCSFSRIRCAQRVKKERKLIPPSS